MTTFTLYQFVNDRDVCAIQTIDAQCIDDDVLNQLNFNDDNCTFDMIDDHDMHLLIYHDDDTKYVLCTHDDASLTYNIVNNVRMI
jgi:hypothetical protein